MKLKAKLAQKHMLSSPRSDYTGDVCDTDIYLAYMAGFEKAREMLFNKIYDENPSLAGLGILEVGEEEVT